MKTLFLALLMMATAVTANADLIIPNGSDEVDISKITRSKYGNWLQVTVQTGRRGTLKCTALDSIGRAVKTVYWFIEHRYSVVLIEVGKDADSVSCGW